MASKRTKTRREDESRLRRARALAHIDPRHPGVEPPPGAVPADARALAHNNTYGPLPRFYIDRVVVCRRCGKEEVWPAERQKWWYETAKGHIDSTAVYCRDCRRSQAAPE